jgi:hypothetical protein
MNKMHRDIHIEEKPQIQKMRDKILTIDFGVYGFRVAYIYTCIFVNKEEKKLGKYIHVYI